MDELNLSGQAEELIALTVVVVGLAAGYGKAFGGYQTTLSQWVIDAFAVPSRFRGLVNLVVGILIAGAFSAIAARAMGSWELIAIGIFAGFLASVEAGRKHDEEAVPPEDEPPRTASRFTGRE